MSDPNRYCGILQDRHAGMTGTGKIIRDAWVFGLLPETQTCEGWTRGQLDALYEQVHAAWEPYGHLVSRLPPELRERHTRIYEDAIRRAREAGWDPNQIPDND
jgi:hypothetical protein